MTSGIHKQWKLARLKKELRSRLDHIEYGSASSEEKQLADYLCETGEWENASSNGWVPSIDLGLLGLLYQRQGAFAVLDGDEGGWQRLAQGTLYALRAAQFDIIRCDREFPQNQRKNCSFRTYGDLLPCLLSLGWVEEARRFAPWWINAVITGYCFDSRPPFRNRSRWFYLRLMADYLGMQGVDWPEYMGSAPQYDALLDGWREPPEILLQMLVDACDLHTHECFGRSDAEDKQQDFADDVIMGWPIEIHMILRLRNELGLANPEIDHPLMQTGLGQMPEPLPFVSDELLDALTAKVCEIYSELGERL